MTHDIDLHILDKGSGLQRVHPGIAGVAEATLCTVRDRLQIQAIDVVIYPGRMVIPELGMMGWCYGPHHVAVVISPELSVEPEVFERRFLETLGHELHHAVRSSKVRLSATLGEKIVSEGLACRFSEELVGEAPFYAKLPDDVDAVALEQLARVEARSAQFDNGKWFFGAKPLEVPRNAGYALGYRLVVGKLAELGMTAAQAVWVPAVSFE